jgi:hypothetical protein
MGGRTNALLLVLPLSVVDNSGWHSCDKLDIDPVSGYPYGLLINILQTVRTPDVPKATEPADFPGPMLALDLVDSTTRSFWKDIRASKTEAAPQTAPPDAQ